MISKLAGIISNKNTKTKVWWIKLGGAIVLSNVFFFLLFGGNNQSSAETFSLPKGWVEVQLEARLHTPFQNGKKVLLMTRTGRKKISGMLNKSGSELDQRITVLVKEEEAALLFQHDNWEILPLIQNIHFQTLTKRESHEIRY
ncbi:MAG: hypothetical protein ACJ76H_09710 [Bacteriovoracaceae bacterium]